MSPNAAEATPPEPDTSDDYIVSKTIYDPSTSDTGPIIRTVDNAGTITETQYDLLVREIRTIQNYANGTVDETDLDQDVTTEYEYDAYGRLATIIAYNAQGDDSDPNNENIVEQATVYLYESDYNASWQTGEVYADSADVLYQDPTTKVWTITTDNGDHTSTEYDRIGRTVTTTDQRGVVHTYGYDSAGRAASDTVTLPQGSDVDDSVLRIDTTYDDIGRIETITSYSDTSATTIVNQIEYVYDGWGNLYQEYQEHDGAVDANTLCTQYNYADGDTTGTGPAQYVRLTEVVYPSGREVNYDYASGVDDIMSRISAIYDDADDDGEIDPTEDVYASYKYLGTGTIVEENYESAQVKLDYNADDNLAGFDRFGRVVDQIWTDYSTTPETVLDEYTYTYDRAGNRTSKDNELNSDLDETYTYDDLYRLASVTRYDGFDQSWTLDSLGNWLEFDDDGSTEDQTVNEANEVTSVSGTSVVPTYDAAGNMTSGPDPDDSAVRIHYVYDSWNRLVEVRTDDPNDPGEPDDLIAAYEYDGQNRRIVKGVDDDADGSLDTFTHYFLNSNNQVLETRTGDDLSGEGPTADSLTPTYQNIWSPRYIDSMILRDEYDAQGSIILANRIFYLSDVNGRFRTGQLGAL